MHRAGSRGQQEMMWGGQHEERVGRVGMLFGSVSYVALEYILLPPLPLLHSDLVLGKQWLPPSWHTLDLLCCVCANVDGLPLQTSVKIANGFSLYFAILMGVGVPSSCFAYSEAPDCSFPGAPELQSCKKCPWSSRDLSWKVISLFVSCCCGGLGVGVVGVSLASYLHVLRMWILMSV